NSSTPSSLLGSLITRPPVLPSSLPTPSSRTTLEHHFSRTSFPPPGFLRVFGLGKSSPARGGNTEVVSARKSKFPEARPLPRRVTMKSYASRLTLGVASAALMLFSIGCGSSSTPTNSNPQPQNGTVNLLLSDASTE